MHQNLIYIIGPAGVGKSTLRRVLFDKGSTMDLLVQTLQTHSQNLQEKPNIITGQLITCEVAENIIEKWLQVKVDHFQGTCLFLLVLDITQHWENNLVLVEQTVKLRDFQCPNAIIAVFFHKFDLLAQEQQDLLREKVKNTFNSLPNFYANLTSISSVYLLETCRFFITVLSESLGFEHFNRTSSLINKLSLFILLLRRGNIKLKDLQLENMKNTTQLESIISELETAKLIQFNPSLGEINFDKRGTDFIQKMNEDISSKLVTSHSGELNYVDALILSDETGRTFQIYERIPGFFDHISLKETEAAIPDIISMFFSAVQGFYGIFDTPGLFEFHLKGRRMQIIWHRYEHMCAIFFLSVTPLVIDPSIHNALQNFTRKYFAAIEPELMIMHNFQIVHTLSTEDTPFFQHLTTLNNDLRKIYALKNKILIDDIFTLYGLLPQITTNPATRGTIRHLIYHYLLQEDPQLLKEIKSKE